MKKRSTLETERVFQKQVSLVNGGSHVFPLRSTFYTLPREARFVTVHCPVLVGHLCRNTVKRETFHKHMYGPCQKEVMRLRYRTCFQQTRNRTQGIPERGETPLS